VLRIIRYLKTERERERKERTGIFRNLISEYLYNLTF
jgi:hypothetical protein